MEQSSNAILTFPNLGLMQTSTRKKKVGGETLIELFRFLFFSIFLFRQNPVVNPAKIHNKKSFFQFFFHLAKKFHIRSYDAKLFINLFNNVWKVFFDNIVHVEK